MNLKIAFLVLAVLVLGWGCGEDDNPADTGGTWTPADCTWADGSGGYYLRLNASSSASYRYYDLVGRQVVEVSDAAAAADNRWHLAFKRYAGKLNGGASGTLGVEGVDLADLGLADSTDFDAVTSVPPEAAGAWESDYLSLVFDGWYIYIPGQGVDLTRNLFLVKCSSGGYAKVVIDSIWDHFIPPDMGSVRLRYVWSATTDLSGAARTATVTVESGRALWSFARGDTVNADPTASTDWDLMFQAYDVRTNSGVSGPGTAAVLPMGGAPFESVGTVPAGAPFFTDSYASVFTGPVTDDGSQWYEYRQQNNVHELVSRRHVYIIKLPGDRHFKLQIQNYYLVVGGTPQSGWLTMRFKEL